MSAKDDLAFVKRSQRAWLEPGGLEITENMSRLLALAERGARFTPEHEAELKAWRVADDEGREPCDDGGAFESLASEARRLRALNERREKEGER